jgi:tetratricopeptide (TPR) repeat protein
MALFNPDAASALKDLDEAREDLSDTRTSNLLPGDRDNELALILQARAFIAVNAGKTEAAQATLKLLENMAKTNRSTPVQEAYHSANGAVLFAHGDYANAIAELQEDPQNPLSLQLQAEAQTKAGQSADARKTLETLASISDERMETALAAPPARLALKRDATRPAQGGAN